MTTSAERVVEPSLDPRFRPRRPIIAAGLRPVVLALMVVAAGALAALSIAFYRDRSGNALDDAIARHLRGWLNHDQLSLTLHTSDQRLTAGLLVLVVLGSVLARRWDIAVFTAVSPIVAVVCTEYVLKPIIGRYLTFGFAGVALPQSGAFPSGHETGLATLTIELAVLVLRLRVAAGWRALVVAALALWTVVGAVGLTANLFHYATDTVGGLCVAIVVVLGVALLVDAASARLSSPAARSLPSTSRAA